MSNSFADGKSGFGVSLDDLKGIKTGIGALDELLGGGIPNKSQVLLAGGPGTGKTLISFEILYRAAMNGVPCSFITLDQSSDNAVRNIKATLTDMTEIDRLVKKNILSVSGEDSAAKISANIESETSYSLGNLISDVEATVKMANAKIAVIDSLSFLKLMLGKSILYNKAVSALTLTLRRLEVTGIFTTDIPYYSRRKIKFAQELLLFDGLIALYHLNGKDEKEDLALEIIKMRGMNHQRTLSHYEITKAGIKI
jgi:KaiC/GvpD/RAD55 family RecA-like ATPase